MISGEMLIATSNINDIAAQISNKPIKVAGQI